MTRIVMVGEAAVVLHRCPDCGEDRSERMGEPCAWCTHCQFCGVPVGRGQGPCAECAESIVKAHGGSR